MALHLPNNADGQDEDLGSVLLSDSSDNASLLDELDSNYSDTRFDDPPPLAQFYGDGDDDPKSSASSQHMSPDAIVVTPTRVSSSTPISLEYEDLVSDEGEVESGPLSPFETLPTELFQSIATHANSDLDLVHLALTSRSFATRLDSDNADVWRKRFLSRYDYPILQNVREFAIAYQVRRLVLRKFDGRAFALGQGDRAEHQLLVIKDMVLETYNKPKPHLPHSNLSKNLAAMCSITNSPWILKFMGCALYGNEKSKYGRPHLLFDTLQIILSHLVLSQRSPVLLSIQSSRDNYDLARVYNYNKPLVMLLERLYCEPEKSQTQFKSTKSRKLRSSTPEPAKPRYKLDVHTLLHIRNFWQRHSADDVQGIGENTYASMARSLVALGKTPQKWDHPLQEQIPLFTKWYGHYSCLHPWPRSRQDLEERQSCAEDWKHIDPMMLELETSTSNKDGEFWPPVFSTIPEFAATTPEDRYHKEYNLSYIRGIAPFLELKHHEKHKNEQNDTEAEQQDKLPRWHPFLASRVHGFIHDIPDASIFGRKPRKERFRDPNEQEEEKTIPGWKHIVMIIYKPASRLLLSVLEHAMEDYGGASGTEMNFNTAEIWNEGNETIDTAQAQSQQTQDEITAVADTIANSNNAAQTAPADTNDGQPTEEQIETQFRLQITRRLKSYSTICIKRASEIKNYELAPTSPYRNNQKPKLPPKPLPPLFSPGHIRQLEEAHSPAAYMTWDDGSIEYAYAYEGVIIPGGKIMLGRWWRVHGREGLGVGREVGPDGVGVEVRAVVVPSEGEDGSYEDETNRGKRKAKRQGKSKTKRRSTRKKAKRKIASSISDDENGGENDADYENEEYGIEEGVKPEKETEYEFVTMRNGEESRAVNACKGLDRGPFVFWAS